MTIDEIAAAAVELVTGAEAQAVTPCARRVVAEVATEYFPVVERVTVTPQNGWVAFDTLERYPRRVYAVTRNGAAVPFTLLSTGLEVKGDGAVEVTVAVLPDDDFVDERVPLRTYAYGTAAEYCLVNGLFDEAALYDKRFRDSLARLHKGGARLPKRRWL